LSNTASLAMMGTLAGPWGVAIGAGAGAVMDLSSALDVSTSSVASFNAALASGSADQMLAEIAAIEKELASLANISELNGIGDFAKASRLNVQDAFANIGLGEFSDSSGDLERRKSVLEGQVEAAQRAALAEAGFSDAVRQTGEDAGFTASQLLSLADNTEQSSAAAWGAFDAQTRLGESLDSLAEAANKGKRGLDASAEGGRENRTELSNLAVAWEQTKAAMEANGAATEDVEAQYRNVRRSLIEAAIKMGATKKEARELAGQLEKPMSLVIKDKTQGAVASAKAAIADLRRSIEGKPIIQRVEVQRTYGKGATVGTPGGMTELLGGGTGTGADGATVPKTGLPYADRHLYLLADGERVTSNRYGQVDRSRKALDLINSGQLNDRILGLADGGTAGKAGKRNKNMSFLGYDIVNQVPRSLKDFINGLEASRDALQSEISAREDVAKQLGESVMSKLTTSLFPGSDIWSAGGTWQDVIGGLNGGTASANMWRANADRLSALGLDEPGALSALLTQASPEDLANLAATATQEQIAQYEQAFQMNAAAVAGAGAQAQAAQYAAMAAELAASRAELVRLNAQFAAFSKNGPAATGAAAGKAAADAGNKGAGKGARNRNRSALTR
ncbi:hypothetical protein, partial [Pimelobacter simplex]|uniref:hypothetical protein n=1 Tax=Nocardioides simplex TaxID=2045 RepID=UPI0019345551|nr:hypothetical protein [Pimelobacter simplex]